MSRYIKRLIAVKQRGNIDLKFSLFDINTISILTMSLIAGFSSYLNKNIKNPKGSRFDLFSLIAHMSASVLAAFIANSVLKSIGVNSENIQIAVSGLAGWAGITAMDFFAYVGRMKILTYFGYTQAANNQQFQDTSINNNLQHTQQPQAPIQTPIQTPITPTPVPIQAQATNVAPTPVLEPPKPPAEVATTELSGREARLARKAAAQENKV